MANWTIIALCIVFISTALLLGIALLRLRLKLKRQSRIILKKAYNDYIYHLALINTGAWGLLIPGNEDNYEMNKASFVQMVNLNIDIYNSVNRLYGKKLNIQYPKKLDYVGREGK